MKSGALHIEVSELFALVEIFKNINSVDITIIEKVKFIEQLDEKENLFII